LGEFVDGLPETDKLAELLTMVGLEVEGVEQPDPRLVEGLVVARINARETHPNADRLDRVARRFEDQEVEDPRRSLFGDALRRVRTGNRR
jgi:tRNA-binding EMAP/Myf-like protein